MWDSEEKTLSDLTREICLSHVLGGPREAGEVTTSALTGSFSWDLTTPGTVTGTGSMEEGLTGSDMMDTGAGAGEVREPEMIWL